MYTVFYNKLFTECKRIFLQEIGKNKANDAMEFRDALGENVARLSELEGYLMGSDLPHALAGAASGREPSEIRSQKTLLQRSGAGWRSSGY